MTLLIKGMALFVAIACLTWLGVLWRWQVTRRDMSVEDIVVYLGLLPLALFTLVLLGRWAFRGASARAAAAASVPAGAGNQAAASPPAVDEAHRRRTLQLLAAHLQCAVGSDIDSLLDAAAAGEPRPPLDEQLRNAEGLPVMCARVAELAVDGVAADLERHAQTLRASRTDWQGQGFNAALPRALALLQQPLQRALSDLSPWAERLGVVADADLSTQPGQQPPRLPQATLRVVPAWPEGTNDFERELAGNWLLQRIKADGQGNVAAPRCVVASGRAVSGPELWLEGERLQLASAQEGRDDLLMLLACHSDVTDSRIEQLEHAGRLFDSRNPKGVIPGEAAAVLVLGGERWPPARPDSPPGPHLHRAAVARRDKSIEAAGRVGHELASEVLRQALDGAGMKQAEVAAIANDANQHSARGAEMFGAMLAELPHLDPVEDMRMAGHLCGSTGAAATLMAVAMAAKRASDLGKPGLALSVADPHWRLALVARPTAAPEAAAPVTA